MKYLIASDLHGSSFYVSKLEKIIENSRNKHILIVK